MTNTNFDSDEINALEKISDEYLKPDPGRIVDKKLVSMIVDEVLPWIEGPEVLEMGFGDDEWTTKIINKIGHSNIVDASTVLLKTSKEKYKDKIQTYESLFENFKPDKKFNTIISSYILEHVEDPVLVLKNALEWLAPTGKLIAIVPHAGSFHRRLAVAMNLHKNLTDLREIDHRMGHRRVYTLEAFDRDIIKAGFNIEKKTGFFAKFLPQYMMTSMSDKMLKGFMDLGMQLPIEYATSIAFVCTHKK
jgi:ubiquinone/menaquinone biosynthesis C-methylase UbiE